MKKIVIIGGGISGLSAGIYAQLNGYDSVIVEKNSIAGGECIGWERDGCYIDGCIHWLTGSNSGGLNALWKRVGALENVGIIEPEYLYLYKDGQTEIKIYRDVEKFRSTLIAVSPEDRGQIDEFIGYVTAMKGMSMPLDPLDVMKLSELMKLGKSMMKLRKTMKAVGEISIGEYADRFVSKTLRKFLLSYMPPEYQLMSLVVSIATFVSGNGNIPEGSSQDFSNRMRDKYLSLGGKIRYNTTISELIITGGAVRQVVTQSGETFDCDYCVPSCDADVTYHKLLKGKYNDREFENKYSDPKVNPLIANCYFAYSVDSMTAQQLPHMSILDCAGVRVGNKVKTLIGLKVYDYIDNGNGLTTLVSPLLQDGEDYAYWAQLYKTDKAQYVAEKTRVGEEIQRIYTAHYPALAGRMKLIDSATPVTYSRYLGAYKGAYMAFMLTKDSRQMMHDGRIKGIKNCYMAGQWLLTPGGLPSALVTGKFAVQRICKADKKAFVQ